MAYMFKGNRNVAGYKIRDKMAVDSRAVVSKAADNMAIVAGNSTVIEQQERMQQEHRKVERKKLSDCTHIERIAALVAANAPSFEAGNLVELLVVVNSTYPFRGGFLFCNLIFI
jgi:hypothetical protein